MAEPTNGRLVTFKWVAGVGFALLVPIIGAALAIGALSERITTNTMAIERLERIDFRVNEIHAAVLHNVCPKVEVKVVRTPGD